jgi:hypothetical protein
MLNDMVEKNHCFAMQTRVSPDLSRLAADGGVGKKTAEVALRKSLNDANRSPKLLDNTARL